MTQVETDPGFALLTAKISSERGFGCASYKEKCLRRRIAVRMRAKGVHTYADYIAVLDREPAEYERLLDALTINVTKFFRNWETYEAMRRIIVPALWDGGAQVRIWSAGSSSGEEPYSLAALFHAHAEARRETDRLARRLTIVGTDIDKDSLEAAARGEYEEAAFADTPPELRRRYFSATAPWTVVPELRPLVRFERRDLLREPPPGTGFQLVTCRNVIIYFDRGTQEALFERFYEALAPGGYLVLGKVETLLGAARSRFVAVDARERIFPAARVMEHRVKVADYAVARGPDEVLVTIGLGSCVAIALYDGAARVGGLAHVLLPSEGLSRDATNRAKFPTTAVPLLVGEMRKLGATGTLTAKIVGGASMFSALLTASAINIGERNVLATRAALEHAGISLRAQDVGGDYGRSVYFHLSDGRVAVRSLKNGDRSL